MNLYQYAPNALGWVDPWACSSKVTRGSQGQPLSARVTITSADLRTGTGTNASSRAFAKLLGLSNDEAGHILGRILGGYGGKNNTFSQLRNLNRGEYRVFEKRIYDYMKNLPPTEQITLKWRFLYGQGGTRPTHIVYQVYHNNQNVFSGRFINF